MISKAMVLVCAHTAFQQAAEHVRVAVCKMSRQDGDPRASDGQVTLMSQWHCLEHCSPSHTAGSNRWLSFQPWAVLMAGRQAV